MSASELERRLTHELIERLMATGRFAVVDRTLLKEILAEQALTLSGLVAEPPASSEPTISATDYLMLLKVSALRLEKRRLADIPDLTDSPFLVRGIACCKAHVEAVSTHTGEVAWTWSAEGTASATAESERKLDGTVLALDCAVDAVGKIVDRLKCVSLP